MNRRDFYIDDGGSALIAGSLCGSAWAQSSIPAIGWLCEWTGDVYRNACYGIEGWTPVCIC